MSDTRRQAMRDRLTIRRRVVLDPRWISAEHHRDLSEAERPRAPEWIDETAADAETVYWAIEQLAALDDVTADDGAFVRDYLVYALVKMEAGAALTAACLTAIDQLERRALRDDAFSRPAKLITLYPCLTRRTILETATTAGAPSTTQTFNDVRIAAWPLDLAGLALALTSTGFYSSMDEATAEIDARLRPALDDLELELAACVTRRLFDARRGPKRKARLIDEIVHRYTWHWYPRALDLASYVNALKPYLLDLDRDALVEPDAENGAPETIWKALTIGESVTYQGPTRRLTYHDEGGVEHVLYHSTEQGQVEPFDLFTQGATYTDHPFIYGREHQLFTQHQTLDGPLWWHWLKGLPTALLPVDKLAKRLTAADLNIPPQDVDDAIAARSEPVKRLIAMTREHHDALIEDARRTIRHIADE